ncbi:MAG: hypothetical protein K5872_05150 [Rhizobiaceae bacterium]|nr:hypothetical protein [Rhizobiaceae bacterium]MCV0405597.1 hypothetical protein [Rhizobiaceae bacterium]
MSRFSVVFFLGVTNIGSQLPERSGHALNRNLRRGNDGRVFAGDVYQISTAGAFLALPHRARFRIRYRDMMLNLFDTGVS